MKEVEKWQPYATINNKVLGTSKRSIQFGELVDAVCDAFVGDVDVSPVERGIESRTIHQTKTIFTSHYHLFAPRRKAVQRKSRKMSW